MISPVVIRWAMRALLLLHAMAALALAGFAVREPLGNWDIVPYAALVQRAPGLGAEEVSRLAHDDVRRYLGDARFRSLIAGGEGGLGEAAYQARMFREPDALMENLRFYDVKPLYIGLARLADRFTGNAAAAAVAVSAAAFALALAMFPLFFRHRLLAIAGAWLLVLTGSPPLALVAAAASPDSLSLLFATACGLLAVKRKPMAWVAAAGVLAVLSRPDAAFILCPLFLGLAWVRRAEGAWRPPLALMAALFAIFVMLGSMALPWSTLFHHTFFERLAYPVTGPVPPMTLARYLGAASVTLPHALEMRVLIFIALALSLALGPLGIRRRIEPFQVLAAAALAGIVLHVLVFPIDEFGHERMFLGSYFLILGAALAALDARARLGP